MPDAADGGGVVGGAFFVAGSNTRGIKLGVRVALLAGEERHRERMQTSLTLARCGWPSRLPTAPLPRELTLQRTSGEVIPTGKCEVITWYHWRLPSPITTCGLRYPSTEAG